MPRKSTQTHYIKFTVKEYADQDAIIKYIHRYDKRFFVLEEGERGGTHIQGIIFTENTETTVRNDWFDTRHYIKPEDSETGKGHTYSISDRFQGKKISYEGAHIYLRYLCKGYKHKQRSPIQLLSNSILIKTDVKEYQDKYWEDNELRKKGKTLYDKISRVAIPRSYLTAPPLKRWLYKITQHHIEESKILPHPQKCIMMAKTYMIRSDENPDVAVDRYVCLMWEEHNKWN